MSIWTYKKKQVKTSDKPFTMETNIADSKKTKNNQWIWIGLICLFIVTAVLFGVWFKLADLEERGSFGDMFGVANALFSGLAFSGMIIAILLQRTELRYQREELTETRKEFAIQNKTLRLQRFENTFFNLLSVHHQIVNGIDHIVKYTGNELKLHNDLGGDKEGVYSGGDVFKLHYFPMMHTMEHADNFLDVYADIYSDHQSDFGHYFRNLYQIIKFVDETEFHTIFELAQEHEDGNSAEDFIELYENRNFATQYRYTSMMRAQLSDYELLWLFYNCLSVNGLFKFKPLIEKYSLLKHLPVNMLHDDHVGSEYSESAFTPVHK
jgi:hypothetical protein